MLWALGPPVAVFPLAAVLSGVDGLRAAQTRRLAVRPVSLAPPRCVSVCAASAGQAQPDLLLPPPPGGAEIFIFGAIHGEQGSDIGDFILRRRPAAVVVETALNAAHGSATGNVAHLQHCLAVTPSGTGGACDGRTLALARLAADLAATEDPRSTALWADISRSPVFYCEHVAYVAAFAVGARLVYGDRPKRVTYQRMLWRPSVADLDAAYGLQSALNYHELVSHKLPPKDLDAASPTDQVFMVERDAVMLKSLHEASLRAGAGQAVVGVVGASHLAGMHRLWGGGGWREVAAGAMDLPEEGGSSESQEAVGVRRALFDSVIRLCCRHEVTADIAATLGPPPLASAAAYDLTHELYGNSRMLLAVLDEEQLSEVCRGWRCDMWHVLEPLRAVRPVNGGPGYDKDLVMDLRTLNFELGPPKSRA